MEYRGRTEIVAIYWTLQMEETTKTKIMYTAFLSYDQLNEYLSILIENNLVEYWKGTQ